MEAVGAVAAGAAAPVPLPGSVADPDRAALEGILFVARTGLNWNDLPTAMFGASGATFWRRLKDWHQAGVWQQLPEMVLAELRAAGRLDWLRSRESEPFGRGVGNHDRLNGHAGGRENRPHQLINMRLRRHGASARRSGGRLFFAVDR